MKKLITEYLDYTVLKPDATKEIIIKICQEAIDKKCASVCVNPCHVKLVKSLVKNSGVGVCTVVGFPLGATTKETKAYEAKQAIKNGATEIDMVINIGAVKDNNLDYVKEDIKAVLDVCKSKNALLKVIIETCLLNNVEKEAVTNIILEIGADFVKTSTGFSTGGATVEDVKLLKSVVKNKAKIKASGGIKDYETAVKMLEAGADRLGTSKLITM